jgi:O-antigen/teichoic acid export membrane protein
MRNPGAFARNVAATFSIQALALLLTVAYTAVLGRWLGSEGKGILELVVLVPSLLGLFLSGGLGPANTYFASSGGADVPTLASNSVSFVLIATLLGFGIIWLSVATGWNEKLLPGLPVGLLTLAMVGLPLELLGGFLRNILQGSRRIVAANMANLFRVFTLLLLTLLLLVKGELGLRGALYASLASGMLQLLALVPLLRQHGATLAPRWHRPTMRQTLRFGMKGHIGTILQFYNYRLDLFLVNFFVGPAAVGIYYVSVRMAEALWFLPNAVGFVILPKAAATAPEKMNAFTPRAFRVTIGITILGSMGLAALGKPIIQLVYTEQFADAYVPLLVLLPGVVLLGGAKVLTNEIAGRGFPQYNSINAGLVLIVTIVLDLYLIPRLGIKGAAIASSLSYTSVFFLALYFHRVVRRKSVNVGARDQRRITVDETVL